ncbi:MAG: DUF2029 domain-containing protein [Aridibacter famidurans]|nr:DUF2029 domain-containing protein [Aridibacter famidurans]
MRIRPYHEYTGAVLILTASVGYLLFKIWETSGSPGYDFRFIWVAGRAWLQGVNPYSAEYLEVATSLVLSGSVPVMWVYPPTWFLITAPFGYFDISTSYVLWNFLSVLLLLMASVLLVANAKRDSPVIGSMLGNTGTASSGLFALFALHCLFLSVLEPTALTLSVGQTSLIVYWGLALVMTGISLGKISFQAIGLTVLLLKPQLGIIFIIPFLFAGVRGWLVTIYAGILSFLLCIPPLILNRTVLFDFLANLGAYDTFTRANDPTSMTGIRIILFELFGRDIGNVAATAVALVFVAMICFLLARKSERDRRLAISVPVITAVCLALAPLHTYDFVIVGVLPFSFFSFRLRSGPSVAVLAALGFVLVLRPENLALATGFFPSGVEIFPGASIASWGAVLLMASMLISSWQCLRSETDETEGNSRAFGGEDSG